MSTTTAQVYADASNVARRAIIADAMEEALAVLEDPELEPCDAQAEAFAVIVRPKVIRAAVALGPRTVIAEGPLR